MKTAYDQPDWESQMRSMLGDDADEMIRRFHNVIDNWVPPDEPVGVFEVAVSQEDVERWLPAAHRFLDETEYDEIALRDFVWNAGFALCRTYMSEDAIEADDDCSDAMRYFVTPPDDIEYEDEDDDDDDEAT